MDATAGGPGRGRRVPGVDGRGLAPGTSGASDHWLHVLIAAVQHGRADLDERRPQRGYRHGRRRDRRRRGQAGHQPYPADAMWPQGRPERGDPAPGGCRQPGTGEPGARGPDQAGHALRCPMVAPVARVLPGPVPAPDPVPGAQDDLHQQAEQPRPGRRAAGAGANAVQAAVARPDLADRGGQCLPQGFFQVVVWCGHDSSPAAHCVMKSPGPALTSARPCRARCGSSPRPC
ncbi:MAG: hypothetical protein JWM19_5222 [Actinomycetia bacterium]|nr:hypothetical protein [Actinomycetes bacterium]